MLYIPILWIMMIFICHHSWELDIYLSISSKYFAWDTVALNANQLYNYVRTSTSSLRIYKWCDWFCILYTARYKNNCCKIMRSLLRPIINCFDIIVVHLNGVCTSCYLRNRFFGWRKSSNIVEYPHLKFILLGWILDISRTRTCPSEEQKIKKNM